jgi:outer membrane immunogenic protein
LDDAFTTLRGVAVDPSGSSTLAGWTTVGTGTEWVFAPHGSVTLEYAYCDFGDGGRKLTDTANNAVVTVNSFKDTINAVTAGLNYRF